MSMPAELATFKIHPNASQERLFQAEYIVPLMHQLGFSVVWDSHGTREFGRDIIFADIDRFGDVLKGERRKSRRLLADSEELHRNSGLLESNLIVVGTEHRLADPEPLAKMLEAVERASPL